MNNGGSGRLSCVQSICSLCGEGVTTACLCICVCVCVVLTDAWKIGIGFVVKMKTEGISI